MSRMTLLDLAKLRGNEAVVGIIEENIKSQPELSLIPSLPPIGKTSFKVPVRTGYPTAGFRAANNGVAPSKSSFRDEIVNLHILSGRIECDKSIADVYEFGGAAGFQALETAAVGEAALRSVGSQVYYGTAADGMGFRGLKYYTPTDGSFGYVLDATGSTASTASSAYFIKTGTEKDVNFVWGNNTILDLGDFRIETINGENDQPVDGYVATLNGWIGLMVANKHAVGRIYNLTAQSGKGLTMTLINQMLAKFPTGKKPNVLMVSRRSMQQLQDSLTVTSTIAGQPVYGRPPSESEVTEQVRLSTGLTVVQTDSILDTDAIGS